MLLTKKDLVLLFLQKKKKRNFKNQLVYHNLKFFYITSINTILGNCNSKEILKLNLCYSSKIKVKTNHSNTLNSFIVIALEILTILFKKSQIQIDYLPVLKQNVTVLRSPFVYKKTREQFTKKEYGVILRLNCNAYSPLYLDYFINLLLSKLNSFLMSKIEITETIIKE